MRFLGGRSRLGCHALTTRLLGPTAASKDVLTLAIAALAVVAVWRHIAVMPGAHWFGVRALPRATHAVRLTGGAGAQRDGSAGSACPARVFALSPWFGASVSAASEAHRLAARAGPRGARGSRGRVAGSASATERNSHTWLERNRWQLELGHLGRLFTSLISALVLRVFSMSFETLLPSAATPQNSY